ncbi:MAG: glycosyltransferase family 2 protein [Nitrospiraceae bacterium]|nr:glycosyltransferase family 2 protein [Nitrospiraceae bacterium]
MFRYDRDSVCAVIVSYNGKSTIAETVGALKDQVGHLLIVDNASDEATKEELRLLQQGGIAVLYNETNRGVASALNQGIDYARSKDAAWLLTFDQDSVAAPGMVERLLSCAQEHRSDTSFLLVSPAVIDRRFPHGSTPAEKKHEYRYTAITSGNLVPLEVYDRVGAYNDRLFIDSVDFDFSLRIREEGGKILRCCEAELFHALGNMKEVRLLGLTFRLTVHSPFRKYFIMRNHIYLLKRFFFSFPLYCLRKQLDICNLVFQTILFEDNKRTNLRRLWTGFLDGIAGNFDNTGSITGA